jgi:spermidine synthase
MKPFNTIAQVRTPDGAQLALLEHDGEHYLKLNGRQLMSTYATASELALAQHSCARLARHAEPRVLIGGLGLGYTLQRVLELVGKKAVVHVSELIPEVVAWNRELLRKVNGKLLDDPRVEVFVGDVFALLNKSAAPRYDAILLDLDNGPVSMMKPENSRVYDRQGFAKITNALLPDGCAAFWSASEDLSFVARLKRGGFDVETFAAPNHERAKQAVHRIYIATRRPPKPEAGEEMEHAPREASRSSGRKFGRS